MAGNYIESQTPIMQNGDFYYPLTTSKQIILPDGRRLGSTEGLNLNATDVNALTVDISDYVEGSANLINADSLGGVAADGYVLETELDEVKNNYALKSEIPTTADEVGARSDTWMPNLNDVSYLGTNIIETQDQDTTQSWRTFGSGYAWYNTVGLLVDQPSQYGFILNYNYGTDIFQIWNAQPGGTTYFRSGNGSGWSNGWRRVFDSNNTPYPVGSIYMSVDSTSPASLFGGTWEQLQDRFLLGAGGSYTVGSAGGVASVALTKNQLPKIEGTVSFRKNVNPGSFRPTGVFSDVDVTTTSVSLQSTSTSSTEEALKLSFGNNEAHNNMPPYLAVYMWKRVS